ncbi:MAG: YdcF family protein [Lachnospiraceae bacterium]|nr:YdcF family protein [Lachnospiraceae bacterium]
MYLIWILLGILFLFYFFSIAFFVGHGTNFYFIWLFLGCASIAFGILLKKGFWEMHVSPLLRKFFLICFCIGLVLFAIVEGCIVSGFSQKGNPGADYVIVLGAQMKRNGPSKALQYRLDEAIRYLNENPGAKVIVSGGKGADEHISEAQGMYDYLVDAGIDEGRIIKEDQSRNTVQNLKFSAEYLDKEKDSVAVVSNNFHIFRAVNIARKAGYQEVCGIAAKGEPFLQWNNMMREFFGVVKDTVFGNM